MIRRRREVELGRTLRCTQHWWRREDDTVWTVAQVYRKDCQALLTRNSERLYVPFEDLLNGWEQIIESKEAAA